ncbi:hypothetical protein L0F63_005187, partial [Massospora cicadina]
MDPRFRDQHLRNLPELSSILESIRRAASFGARFDQLPLKITLGGLHYRLDLNSRGEYFVDIDRERTFFRAVRAYKTTDAKHSCVR